MKGSSSTCIVDGSGQFRWILLYQRQFLDVQQSGFTEKSIPPRRDMNETFIQWSDFFVCPIFDCPDNCLPQTIDFVYM